MSGINYDEMRDKALDALANEREAERQDKQPVSARLAIGALKAWISVYLKRNQPNNYIRITRTEIAPGFYACALQLWTRRKTEQQAHLHESHIIDESTFECISLLPDYPWEVTTDNARQLHKVMRNNNVD